jgi:AcrR family transcriptional regulator
MSATPPRADARRNTRRLLEAATRILGENPQATMEDIAAATEIHRSTIYRRYPTREALIDALLESARQEAVRIVTTASEQPPHPRVLRQLCQELMARGSQYAFLANNHYRDSDLGDDPFQLHDVIARYQDAGVLRADLPAAWLASAFEALSADLIGNKRGIATSPQHAGELLYETFVTGAAGPPQQAD